MPFKSQAQRAYFYKNKPELAAQWEKETPAGKLPNHVGDVMKKKSPAKKIVITNKEKHHAKNF